MNVIGIQRVNKGRGDKVLGLAYVKCVLDPEVLAFKDQGIYDFIEDYGVEHYCLLLPFIDEGNFEGTYHGSGVWRLGCRGHQFQ